MSTEAMSYDKPVRHIRDYLSILGPLSRNEPVSYRGEDYTTNLAIHPVNHGGMNRHFGRLESLLLRCKFFPR